MKDVINYLLHELGLKYQDTVVAGISGGPDSMALLSALLEVKKVLDIHIICAHVNHNLRKESADELIMVETYCRNNGIIFESMMIEHYGDDNFHNEARTIRYRYFEQLIHQYHGKYLFTAHHGDDLMETILMRMVRGSTMKGYSGFSERVPMIGYELVRPLIHLTKEELLQYVKENHIPYAVDASNEKDVYTRNRFRKYILPTLKKEDRSVHDKFYKFSNMLLEYNEYVDNQMKKIIPLVYPQNVLVIPHFKDLEHILQMKIIYYMLEQFYQDDLMLITDHHAELLRELIFSKKANSTLFLPNHVKAIKTYEELSLVIDVPLQNEYEIELDTYANLPNGKNIRVVEKSESTSNFVCRLSKEDIVFPLTVRNRANGDKMSVKGMLGRKKIKDIFIDSKISTKDRDSWPVVVDSAGNIVWLPGLKKSKFDKLKNEKYDIILEYY